MQSTISKLQKYESFRDAAEVDTYAVQSALSTLADLCWEGDCAIAAPDHVWIVTARLLLQRAMTSLDEIESARHCLDCRCEREQ